MSPMTIMRGREEYMLALFSSRSEIVQQSLQTIMGRWPFQRVIRGLSYWFDHSSNLCHGFTYGMSKKLPTRGRGKGPGGIRRRSQRTLMYSSRTHMVRMATISVKPTKYVGFSRAESSKRVVSLVLESMVGYQDIAIFVSITERISDLIYNSSYSLQTLTYSLFVCL